MRIPAPCRSPVPAAALSLLAAVLSAPPASALEVRNLRRGPQGLKTVRQGERDLPVIHRADVVVVGGGVAGVAAALAAAEQGLSAAVIEERNHFGYELAGPMKPTAGSGKIPAGFKTAERILGRLVRKKVYRDGALDASGLKVELNRLVIEAKKVKVYLYSLPSGVLMRGRTVRGVIIVNRSGRQAVLARAVIDATGSAGVAAAAGAKFARPITGQKTVRRFILAKTSGYEGTGEIQVPASLGLVGDKVVVHDLARAGAKPGSKPKAIELAVRAEIGENVGLGLSELQCLTRRAAMKVAAHLRAKVRGFEKLDELRGRKVSMYLGDEPFIDEGPVVACGSPLVPSGVGGLVVAGRIASAAPEAESLGALLSSGEAAGRAAARLAKATPGFAPTGPPVMIREERPVGERVREFLKGPDTGRAYATVHEKARDLPVVDRVDVLVVGGGTSGAPAAIAAAGEGARVALVEILPLLGGVGTTTINVYYSGVHYSSRMYAKVDEFSGGGRWSVERKKLILQEMLLERGGRIYYRTFGAGAVVEKGRVTGAVIENAGGRGVILARAVVDATGHADVAAAAGAAFTKGREGDGFLHAMALTGDQKNTDTGLRDVTNVEDLTGITLKAVGRWKRGPFYMSPQLCPRESRHVVGDHVLTLRDLATHRTFPDVVCVTRSHYDRHGSNYENESATAQYWLLVLGNWSGWSMSAHVPYRSLPAAKLENILVVGRSYSGDHDSQISLRMQRDYQHMGEAAGVAAALAARGGTTTRNVPLKKLQARLVERGVLRAKHLGAKPRQLEPTKFVGDLGTDKAKKAMTWLLLIGEKSVPALRPLLASRKPEVRADAAMVLGMLGSPEAAPALLELLSSRSRRQLKGKPSAPYYWGAAIILGRFKEKRAVPAMAELLEEISREFPCDQAISGKTLRKIRGKMYLAALVIKALGRIGDPAGAAAVRPYLRPRRLSRGRVPSETMPELKWGPTVAAAQALGRMGDLSGVPVLVGFLGDEQALLRDYAQRVLEEITGQKFGKDRPRWQAWWKRQGAR